MPVIEYFNKEGKVAEVGLRESCVCFTVLTVTVYRSTARRLWTRCTRRHSWPSAGSIRGTRARAPPSNCYVHTYSIRRFRSLHRFHDIHSPMTVSARTQQTWVHPPTAGRWCTEPSPQPPVEELCRQRRRDALQSPIHPATNVNACLQMHPGTSLTGIHSQPPQR
jgi:hypothetical protein